MIRDVRQALAGAIASVVDVDPSLPYIPSTLQSGSAFVRPARGETYLTYEDATYTRPKINLAVVIVAGTGDWEEAAVWLDEAVEKVSLDLDPDALAAVASRLVVTDVSEPGTVPTSTGSFLAVAVSFAPLYVKGLRKEP